MFEKAEDFGILALILLILGLIGFAGYEVYEYIQGNMDEEGTVSGDNSLLSKAINGTLAIGNSSQTYATAASETVMHPFDTIGSILGIGSDGN